MPLAAEIKRKRLSLAAGMNRERLPLAAGMKRERLPLAAGMKRERLPLAARMKKSLHLTGLNKLFGFIDRFSPKLQNPMIFFGKKGLRDANMK